MGCDHVATARGSFGAFGGHIVECAGGARGQHESYLIQVVDLYTDRMEDVQGLDSAIPRTERTAKRRARVIQGAAPT
jgi:hypothetical protein